MLLAPCTCLSCARRQALGLERVHLVGHGWGGMLALAYLTTPTAAAARDTPAPSLPLGVASLTLLSTPPTWDALVRDRREKVRVGICSCRLAGGA